MNLTQKISQMTPKGADLAATDLIEVSTLEAGSYVTKSITGQELIDAIPLPPTGLTIGTTPIASGTIGRVLFQGTGNVLQQSSSLFWDSTNNRLGIGTSTPAFALDVNADNAYFGLNRNPSGSGPALFFFRLSGAGGANVGIAGSAADQLPSTVLNDLFLRTNGYSILFGTSGTTWGKFFTTGNLGINTTTDAGFRLDVNGTARVSGNLTLKNVTDELLFANATVKIRRVSDKLSLEGYAGFDFVDTNTSFTRMVINAAGNVGIGTTTPGTNGASLEINAPRSVATVNHAQLRITDGTTGGYFEVCEGYTGSGIYNPTIRGRSAGVSGLGFAVSGIIPSAQDAKVSGLASVVIEGTKDTSGAFSALSNSNILAVTNYGSVLLNIAANGNVGINTTTDAGFRLDVNGTARVKGTGTTIGTTSFTVQDSASSDLFRVYDNGLVAIKAGVISLNGSNGSISGGFIASTGQMISGGTSITASAQMEVISTTRGFLPPRMTTTQRNAIASPAAGLIVYDTTLNLPHFFNGTIWVSL